MTQRIPEMTIAMLKARWAPTADTRGYLVRGSVCRLVVWSTG